MKRISFWFMSTLSALVLLFGYRTSLSGSAQTIAVSSTPKPVTSSGSGGTGDTTSGTTSSGTTSSGTTSSSSSAAKSTTAAASKTVTGSVADTRWGPVQVQITVVNGKVTAVNMLQYPSSNGRDVEINNYALPILIQETTNASSANIDMVSGATVTSTGYIQSLQSALDQAGI